MTVVKNESIPELCDVELNCKILRLRCEKKKHAESREMNEGEGHLHGELPTFAPKHINLRTTKIHHETFLEKNSKI